MQNRRFATASMKYRFDEKLKIALEGSGWHPMRKVALEKYSSAWKAEGYRVFPCALEFTGSFGGLKIKHLSYAGKTPKKANSTPLSQPGGSIGHG